MPDDDPTVADIHRNIENANRLKNPMQEFTPEDLSYVSPSGVKFTMICRSKGDLKPKTIKWAFKLAEQNVAYLYSQLNMGWQPKIKMNDLQKNWARYLIVYDENATPVAYAMFRFDLDYGHSVVYCYEIQIEESCRRLGLGKYIMDLLEKMGKLRKMERVVVTVLKNNPDSAAFFRALSFKVDHSSPSPKLKAEYEILSKDLAPCLF